MVKKPVRPVVLLSLATTFGADAIHPVGNFRCVVQRATSIAVVEDKKTDRNRVLCACLMLFGLAVSVMAPARGQTVSMGDEGKAYVACVAAWAGGQAKCRRNHPYVGMKPNSGSCPRTGGTNVGVYTSRVSCWYETGPAQGGPYSVEEMGSFTFNTACASRNVSNLSSGPSNSMTCIDGCEIAKAGQGGLAPTGRVCKVTATELAPQKNNCCQSQATN